MYDDIEVETYGNNKGELIIYSIRFTGEDVKTNENIGLYSSLNDMIKTYGGNYVKNDNEYTYTKGNTDLIFIVQNDMIESIEYRLNNLD